MDYNRDMGDRERESKRDGERMIGFSTVDHDFMHLTGIH